MIVLFYMCLSLILVGVAYLYYVAREALRVARVNAKVGNLSLIKSED
jgi:hypothetical protein